MRYKKSDLVDPISIHWIVTYIRSWYSIVLNDSTHGWVELQKFPVDIYKVAKNYGLRATTTYVENADVVFLTNYCKNYIRENINEIPSVYMPGYGCSSILFDFRKIGNNIINNFEQMYGIVPDIKSI